MTGGDLLQVMMVPVTTDAAAAQQRPTADRRPEPADHGAATAAADQLRLVMVRRGRGRRVGHHRYAAADADPAAAAADPAAGHRRFHVHSGSEHHFVAGQMVLKIEKVNG